jgi:RHS repeat-associated protein
VQSRHSEDTGQRPVNRLTYTKHYYIRSERISAKTGTVDDLGQYPGELLTSAMPKLATGTTVNKDIVRVASNATVDDAETVVTHTYNVFALTPPSLNHIRESDKMRIEHIAANLNIFYFHPDHLGSSSYITNAAGKVIQHIGRSENSRWLFLVTSQEKKGKAFGETLADEHSTSLNSPFKYNGKEFDEETGNYYYGARYYDPKLCIFISVDPLAEKTGKKPI